MAVVRKRRSFVAVRQSVKSKPKFEIRSRGALRYDRSVETSWSVTFGRMGQRNPKR